MAGMTSIDLAFFDLTNNTSQPDRGYYPHPEQRIEVRRINCHGFTVTTWHWSRWSAEYEQRKSGRHVNGVV